VHLKNNNYKPKEFAELLNVSVRTLQRWDNEGTLKAFRTPTDRRYYTYEQYKEFKGIISSEKRTVIYTRVSTSDQKDDLKSQVEFLKQYANAKGIIVDEIQCENNSSKQSKPIAVRRISSRYNFYTSYF
jgi:Predicted site-specific integrase-resolvase